MPRSWRTDPLANLVSPGRLARGEVKLVLLSTLSAGGRHGYDLMKAVEELSGGRYVPSAGVVYPSLKALAGQGLLKVEEQGERRRYTLTPAGRKHLAGHKEALAAALARLEPREDGLRADVRALIQEVQRLVRELFRQPLADLKPAQVAALRRVVAEAGARMRKILGRVSG
jgi:DNA-binding PadR family transcriptional regulator